MQSGRRSSRLAGMFLRPASSGHGSSESVSPGVGRVAETRTPATGPSLSRTRPWMRRLPLGGGVGAARTRFPPVAEARVERGCSSREDAEGVPCRRLSPATIIATMAAAPAIPSTRLRISPPTRSLASLRTPWEARRGRSARNGILVRCVSSSPRAWRADGRRSPGTCGGGEDNEFHAE